MSDDELIAKFRERMEGWGLNDDAAWVKVKLGEMRAVVRHLPKPKTPNDGE